MARFGFRSVCLPLTFASIACVSIFAQTASEASSTVTKVRDIPAPIVPQPFSTAAPKSRSAHSIEFHSAESMSESDRLLVSNDESSIAEHAATNGFNLDQGQWSYEEIVCPALPNHLFLRYTQNNGDRDITVFSASIPRNGEGRVRIIPIQKRSYSLFSPAPINELTISAFNHIRTEEGTGRSSSWLGNGLCYAALAGANPQLARQRNPGTGEPAPTLTAILEVPTKGGEVIRFVDSAAAPHPMQWTMTFTQQGKLVKATHTSAPLSSSQRVPSISGVEATRPIPQ
jgi:hypothetical protein